MFRRSRLIAAAEAMNGNFARTRIDYALAMDLLATMPHRPELARLGLAAVLLDHYPGEHPEAVKLLDTAIADLGQMKMKMQPSLERALKRKAILKA